VHKFIKDGVSMQIIPVMMSRVNKLENWEEKIIDRLKGKYPGEIYSLTKNVRWPITTEIVDYDEIYIMSGCTWGTLSYRNKCPGCGMTKGNVIVSSCCYTKQIICRCVADTQNNTIKCQNMTTNCCNMDSRELIQTQPRCKLNREEIRLGLVLRRRDKTPVPHIFQDNDI
tara:strand:+ start:58 stop:567 length:510 start_codon:yes stop_codon:yes gene_type:complete